MRCSARHPPWERNQTKSKQPAKFLSAKPSAPVNKSVHRQCLNKWKFSFVRNDPKTTRLLLQAINKCLFWFLFGWRWPSSFDRQQLLRSSVNIFRVTSWNAVADWNPRSSAQSACAPRNLAQNLDFNSSILVQMSTDRARSESAFACDLKCSVWFVCALSPDIQTSVVSPKFSAELPARFRRRPQPTS